MGIHFNRLEELLELPLEVPGAFFNFQIKRFLADHLKATTLTEIPYFSHYMQTLSGKSEAEYNAFLRDYTLNLGNSDFYQEQPQGIEDPQSYTAVQSIDDDRYLLLTCMADEDGTLLECGLLTQPRYTDESIRSAIGTIFAFVVMDNQLGIAGGDLAVFDIANAFTAYTEEAAYLDSLLE